MQSMEKAPQIIWKGLKSFGIFWKNFLLGDAPEIALGVVIILGISFLVPESAVTAGAAIIVMVLILMIITTWRRARKR